MEISIIIPTFNCAQYLERSLRSALSQDFEKKHYEIIVIDDGSTDDTEKILELFREEVRIIKLEKNKGLSYARNYAIKNAFGKYVVCLDADDYISTHLLTIEHMYLSQNNYIDAVSCDYIMVNDKEEIIKRCNAAEHPIACGIMFYKDKLKEIGLYDEKFLALEDLDLRKRYLEKFNIYNIPLPLYRYRDHKTNLTKKKRRLAFYEKKLYEKHKIENMQSHLKNHKNVKIGVTKCS